MMKKLVILFIVLVFSLPLLAQFEEYKKSVFVNGEHSLPYRFLEPENFSKSKKYPVVIFLHGSGERGVDNEKQLIHGAQQFLNPVNREKFPSYVFFPQAPMDGFWSLPEVDSICQSMFCNSTTPTWQINALTAFIDSITNLPSVDKNRIYIMGISMGAMALYELAWRNPSTFAAAVPICGAADTLNITRAKNVYWRIYHGDADNLVPVQMSRNVYKKLSDSGADVQYFEFPGCTHGSWNPAFNDRDLLPWLFSKKRRK